MVFGENNENINFCPFPPSVQSSIYFLTALVNDAMEKFSKIFCQSFMLFKLHSNPIKFEGLQQVFLEEG